MEILGWVEAWWIAKALRESGLLYMFVNAAHILGIGLLVGAILPLDLAVLGILRKAPLAIIGPFLSRAAAVGILLAIATGILLWSTRPRDYLENEAFLWKMALLGFAILNIAIQHGGRGWRLALGGGSVPASSRVLAALSAMIWTALLLAGRWIGFV